MYECQQDCQKQKLIKESDLDSSGSKSALIKEKDLKGNETATQNGHSTSQTQNQLDIATNQAASNRQDDQKCSAGDPHINRMLSSRSSFSNISIKYQDNLNFVYSYIDIERLILDNLKERIKDLGECGLIGHDDELFASDTNLDDDGFKMKSGRRKANKSKHDWDEDGTKIYTKSHVEKTDNRNHVEMANHVNGHRDKHIEHHTGGHTNSHVNGDSDAHIGSHLNSKTTIKDHSTDDDKEMKIDGQTKEQPAFDKKKDTKLSHPTEANAVNNPHRPANQMHQMHSTGKKQTKRKRSIRNENWTEFLKACEEDFEFNQSKINRNYNSRALRECMFTYANCVTNNWVFSLIENEIEKRTQSLKDRFFKLVDARNAHLDNDLNEQDELDCNLEKSDLKTTDANTDLHKELHNEIHKAIRKHSFLNAVDYHTDYVLPEIIYIINLIPNQINIFRHCLFLQQTPNLSNFNINFIAINLMSGDLRKKDLDSVISNSIQDELNLNYMSYFRSLNRLVDVQIRQMKQKIRIRITKGNKGAIKMKTESDVQFLLGALENNQEIDLSGFKVQSERRRNSQTKKSSIEKEKGNLLYIIDDVVDIGDLLFCIEDESLKMSTLRKFIQVYLKQKDKVSFNRLYS